MSPEPLAMLAATLVVACYLITGISFACESKVGVRVGYALGALALIHALAAAWIAALTN